jgi:hypothetical protein
LTTGSILARPDKVALLDRGSQDEGEADSWILPGPELG